MCHEKGTKRGSYDNDKVNPLYLTNVTLRTGVNTWAASATYPSPSMIGIIIIVGRKMEATELEGCEIRNMDSDVKGSEVK